MAVSRCNTGPAFKARDRLGGEQQDEAGPGDPGIKHGHSLPIAVKGLHPSHGSRVAILFARLSENPAAARLQSVHEWQRKLL